MEPAALRRADNGGRRHIAPEPRRHPIASPITAVVGLATIMQALDTTIANVSLPYIQGNLAANQDEVEWGETYEYIVAAAIMTPPTGYLAERFGLKRLFMTSIVGFTPRLDAVRNGHVYRPRSSSSG